MTPGAQCAQHPAEPAQQACSRCGSFMCTTCSEHGAQEHCPACRARLGVGTFPFHPGNVEFGAVFGYCFEVWKKQWVMLSLGVLVVGGIYVGGSLALQLVLGGGMALVGKGENLGALGGVMGFFFLGILVLLMLVGVGFLGLHRMCLDVLLGQPADLSALTSQFPKFGRAVVLFFLMGVLVLVPVIAFGAVVGIAGAAGLAGSRDALGEGAAVGLAGAFIVGYLVLLAGLIYVSLPFTFMMLEMVHSDASALECFRRGWALSDGHRLQIFGYRFVGGVIATLGMLACCVGMLPALALALMLEAALYLALRSGADLPAART